MRRMQKVNDPTLGAAWWHSKTLNMRLNAYCQTFERGRIQCLPAGFDVGLYAMTGFGNCPSVTMRGSRKDLWTG